MIFNWAFAWSILPVLLKASRITALVTFASFGIATVGGLLILWLVRRRSRWISLPMQGVVDIIRGTPLLLQVFFVFYMLPQVGIRLGPLQAGILSMGIHYSCYMAQSYRAALEAVRTPQWHAALALGLTKRQAFSAVIWPQMLPIVVPIGCSFLVYMFKDTPILAAITVREMMQVASQIGADSFQYMEPLSLVGTIFLAMSLVVACLGRLFERRVSRYKHY